MTRVMIFTKFGWVFCFLLREIVFARLGLFSKKQALLFLQQCGNWSLRSQSCHGEKSGGKRRSPLTKTIYLQVFWEASEASFVKNCTDFTLDFESKFCLRGLAGMFFMVQSQNISGALEMFSKFGKVSQKLKLVRAVIKKRVHAFVFNNLVLKLILYCKECGFPFSRRQCCLQNYQTKLCHIGFCCFQYIQIISTKFFHVQITF